jgi:hypothetical protein
MYYKYQIIDTEELGELLGEFNSKSDIGRLIFHLSFVVTGLIMILVIPWGHSRGENNLLGVLLLLVLGLAFIVSGIRDCRILISEGNWCVQMYSAGMLLTAKGEQKLLRWCDIADVRQEEHGTFTIFIFFYIYYVISIQMQNGEKYTFSGFKVERLGNLIKEQWQKTRQAPML